MPIFIPQTVLPVLAAVPVLAVMAVVLVVTGACLNITLRTLHTLAALAVFGAAAVLVLAISAGVTAQAVL